MQVTRKIEALRRSLERLTPRNLDLMAECIGARSAEALAVLVAEQKKINNM